MPQTMRESDLVLFSWPTANGRKVHILLEELGWDYELVPIDIYAGAQHSPEYEQVSPTRKIPVLFDKLADDPIRVFESGAILQYLATKAERFLGSTPMERAACSSWLFFQMASVGPMLGQAFHWRQYANDTVPAAIDRYTDQAVRIYETLERRLSDASYFAGDTYTIADIAIFPWLETWEKQGIQMSDFPSIERWRAKVRERPGAQKGMAVLEQNRHSGALTDDQRRAMIGRK